MADDEHEVDTSWHFVIPDLDPGDRCRIQPGDRAAKVMFIGPVVGMPSGYWVGVQYDEKVGKNDGTLNGKRYFTCPAGHGGFVRSSKVNKLENVERQLQLQREEEAKREALRRQREEQKKYALPEDEWDQCTKWQVQRASNPQGHPSAALP